MAAHWLAVLNPRDLYERLPDLLLGSQGERPSYPPTMSTILDVSYRLLEPTEQRFFERLSIIPRSFSYEEAAREGEETISETLDLLRRLVRKSIVQRASGVVGEFELPRTHRAYGRARRLERITGA